MTVIGGAVVVSAEPRPGMGAPVLNRQPAPGGWKAAMLTIGGGRFVICRGGCVGVVVDEWVAVLVVGTTFVVDAAVGWVVVPEAEGE